MEANLTRIGKTLWAARINATGDQWHLDKRVIPALEALAGQTGKIPLRQAIEHTAKASELLAAARDALAEAIGVTERYQGLAPAAAPTQTTNGSDALPPDPAGRKSA